MIHLHATQMKMRKVALFSNMASRATKTKPFILFLIGFLLFTSHYLKQLHDDIQNAVTYHKLPRNPKWFEIIARKLGDENINVGLVNMGETTMMNEVYTKGNMLRVEFEPVDKSIQWSDLFPEWINEDLPTKCPKLPMPKFDDYQQLDVVVARVPCKNSDREESGLRDVFRLQVNLVVANLLVRSGRKENGVDRDVFVVFIGSCGPMWEIFRCDDLLLNVGNYWVYKPQLWRIKQKVLMPVGSCQLCPPFPRSGEEGSIEQAREAYVSLLHSSEAYVCGAIALAQSIIQSNSTKDLVLLADDHISPKSMEGLKSAGWKIKRIERIHSPHSKKNAYNEWNYSKLRLWQLQDYDKVMFIDSDLIVTRNLDHFFIYPQISAASNDVHMFNSGVMLVEPSTCTFKTLMEKRWVVGSYNGGDQGFLNEMFPWWHRLPAKINKLTYFKSVDDHVHQISSDVYALHYLGLKPWMCYKDYDCNWDMARTQRFASDSANEKWWKVYDKMPERLRHHCSLTPEMNARIVKKRDMAKNAGLADAHWKIQVKDPRQNVM